MKTHRYTSLMGLNYFSQGLLIPVLSFVLMDKGLTLQDIGIAMGAYSVTAAILEVPSGIAADRMGRKRTFILSLFVSVVSFITLLGGHGFLWVILGVVFLGASRALASGTFEALFIDRYQQSFGQEYLPKAMTLLAVSESAGLAGGSLLGGFLPVLSVKFMQEIGPYNLNLILRAILGVMLAILVKLLIPADVSTGGMQRGSLGMHISNSIGTIRQSQTLKRLFISVVGTGFILCSLESYWQPRFVSLLGNGQEQTGLLGVLSLLYLGAITGGNMFSGKILTKGIMGYKTVFLAARLGMFVCMAIAALSDHSLLFAISYCLLYFFFGASNISEGAMVNREVPDRNRASILSVQSLTLQVGALSAATASSLLEGRYPVKVLWLVAALFAAVSLVPSFGIKKYRSYVDCGIKG